MVLWPSERRWRCAAMPRLEAYRAQLNTSLPQNGLGPAVYAPAALRDETAGPDVFR